MSIDVKRWFSTNRFMDMHLNLKTSENIIIYNAILMVNI